MKNIKTLKKIGIPRAISYYHNFPFYLAFFEKLGIEVIISDITTSKTINDGCKYLASETCLPIKVFTGHVINLIEKGVFDLFIPSIQSTSYKVNNCSKIRGLPEIIRNVLPHNINLIEPLLDKTQNIGFYDFWFETAKSVGINDKKLIKSAIKEGWKKYDNFLNLTQNGWDYKIALENSFSNRLLKKNIKKEMPINVVIMAHGYNLFDERISLNLLKKLKKMQVGVYTALDISRQDAINSIYKLQEVMYWANEPELTGSAAYFILNNKVDGIIALSAFGCGPDSLMIDEMNFHASQMKIPLLNLIIDEHTGEAGFVTRLEAFIDMLSRKKYAKMLKQNENTSVIERNIELCSTT